MDFTSFQTLLGLASGAVGLTGQAAATVETVKKVFNGSGKTGNPEAQQLLNSLATQLTSANMMNVQISTAITKITAEIQKNNQFSQRLARYKLRETGCGDLIYALLEDHLDDEPAHFICPICVEKEQQFHFVTGQKTEEYKRCQGCRHRFRFSHQTVRSMPTINHY